jgi:hypothetical protein
MFVSQFVLYSLVWIEQLGSYIGRDTLNSALGLYTYIWRGKLPRDYVIIQRQPRACNINLLDAQAPRLSILLLVVMSVLTRV